MIALLINALIISLIITAIYYSSSHDAIFGSVFSQLDAWLCTWKGGRYYWVGNPIYRCLVCMGGLWSLVLYPLLFGLSLWLIPSMLITIGINVLISAAVNTLDI